MVARLKPVREVVLTFEDYITDKRFRVKARVRDENDVNIDVVTELVADPKDLGKDVDGDTIPVRDFLHGLTPTQLLDLRYDLAEGADESGSPEYPASTEVWDDAEGYDDDAGEDDP